MELPSLIELGKILGGLVVSALFVVLFSYLFNHLEDE